MRWVFDPERRSVVAYWLLTLAVRERHPWLLRGGGEEGIYRFH